MDQGYRTVSLGFSPPVEKQVTRNRVKRTNTLSGYCISTDGRILYNFNHNSSVFYHEFCTVLVVGLQDAIWCYSYFKANFERRGKNLR